eukprot:scaffold22701_cov123-Cylindrotheca_fusiformis.AAC.11
MSSSQGMNHSMSLSTIKETSCFDTSFFDKYRLHIIDLDGPSSSQEGVLRLSVVPKHKVIHSGSETTWTSACVTIQASDLSESSTSAGVYCPIQNVPATLLVDAIEGILSIVAKNAVLKISVLPAAAAMGVRIRDIRHDEIVDQGDGSFTISLGDFSVGECREVPLDLNLSNLPSGSPVPRFQASLSYLDILNERTAVAGPVECSIARPDCNEVFETDKPVTARSQQSLQVRYGRRLPATFLEARYNSRQHLWVETTCPRKGSYQKYPFELAEAEGTDL